MPLLDHFHAPLTDERHWDGFHSKWANVLVDELNEKLLPPGYFAEPHVHLGARVEIDTAEVQVTSTETGPTLVAAIELVSPANKDRAEHRRAFAVKCASYLSQGISLILVDIVTNRRANLHNDIVHLLPDAAPYIFPGDPLVYAAAYRSAHRDEGDSIEVWLAALAVGEALPVLPLGLTDELSLTIDLEATYGTACRKLRLP